MTTSSARWRLKPRVGSLHIQPVCTSEELSDLPRRVKLLCEELVIFRDKKGRIRGDASGPVRL
jgi:hypothetical protein